MSFTWVPYYKEFAEKLLQSQENRADLCRLIYDHEDELLINYLHDEGVRMIDLLISTRLRPSDYSTEGLVRRIEFLRQRCSNGY